MSNLKSFNANKKIANPSIITKPIDRCLRGMTIRRSAAVSRILFPLGLLAGLQKDDNHSSRPAIAGRLKQPTRKSRTGRPLTHPTGACAPALRRFPIWSCSVRGFACHTHFCARGALLPHLFTLTLRLGLAASLRAVYFLCHCPSSCPDRELPGALPSGVRTFLVRLRPCGLRRDAVVCHAASECQRTPVRSRARPYSSCLILYCSSFL